MSKTILLFGAHSDDQVYGAGATLAKYHDLGYKIVVCIFSYGEKSHVWLKPSVIKKIREKESIEAGKIIGCDKVLFLGVEEGKFLKNAIRDNLYQRVEELIKEHKPEKIFLHSHDDPHIDHRHVNKIVLKAIDNARYMGEVYIFDVWNILSYKRRVMPRVFVNVDNYFSKKITAIKLFKSQKITLFSLFWSVYMKALINGLLSNSRFAEKFLRIR